MYEMWCVLVFSVLIGHSWAGMVNTPITTKLKTGEVAYKIKKVDVDRYDFDVTDGQYVWKASTSKSVDDMTSCFLYLHPSKAQQLVQDGEANRETVGQKKIKQMKKKCREYQTSARRATSADDHDTFNHDLAKTMPFKGDFETGAPSGAGSHFAIYPGTKWCGFQNVASNMQDLGVHNQTDACCRTHDHCPFYIDRFETKYHYYNKYPWTVSHCDCDQHLFDCFKKVNNPTSNEVGKLFFGLLDVQCFTFQVGEYCSNESSVLSHLWCSKTKGMKAVMKQFPHKWADNGTDDSNSASDLVG
ncbi:uncharacterized protein LOC128233010 isoform X1 [Mya arenaria]|uniref:uncharacterized protein LOC128233010 isoform X1 n=1 Tax=Mya arenaria TaxID=6604 RepID=UPI0022E2E0D5|nr:uncharacterized protein LOC128233010 isoform X1 [Mya arenaria]